MSWIRIKVEKAKNKDDGTVLVPLGILEPDKIVAVVIRGSNGDWIDFNPGKASPTSENQISIEVSNDDLSGHETISSHLARIRRLIG